MSDLADGSTKTRTLAPSASGPPTTSHSFLVRHREWLSVLLLRLLVFATFAGLWQWFAIRADNPSIATFTGTVGGLLTVLTSGDFWPAFWNSNQAMIIGYAASIITAIPLGLAAGRSKLIDRLSEPYVAIALAMPIAPLIPVVIVALGLGLASRVSIVFLFAFIFMSVNTRAGVKQVDKGLIEMAQSYGASESEVWRLVVLPGASPAIFAGLRIGLGRAVTGMVVVELLLVASGLGKLLLQFDGRLQPNLMFGVIVAIILEMLILLRVMQIFEQRATSWVVEAHE